MQIRIQLFDQDKPMAADSNVWMQMFDVKPESEVGGQLLIDLVKDVEHYARMKAEELGLRRMSQ